MTLDSLLDSLSPRFVIKQVPVKIDWTVILVIFIIALFFTSELLMWIGVYLSIAFHEFGHALIASRLGYHVKQLTIWSLGGGVSIHENFQTIHPAHELKISAAGPACSVIFALPFLGLFMLTGIGVFFNVALVSGAILCGLNLIPIFPLDGARCLRALMRMHGNMSDLRVDRVIHSLGLSLSALVLWLCLFYGMYLTAVFALLGAFVNFVLLRKDYA